jgi:hypothetical protein
LNPGECGSQPLRKCTILHHGKMIMIFLCAPIAADRIA